MPDFWLLYGEFYQHPLSVLVSLTIRKLWCLVLMKKLLSSLRYSVQKSIIHNGELRVKVVMIKELEANQ